MILASNIAGHVLFIIISFAMFVISSFHSVSRKKDADHLFYIAFALLTFWAMVKDATELVIILGLDYVPYANTVAILGHLLSMIVIGFLLLRGK